jgi:hypothetical protein
MNHIKIIFLLVLFGTASITTVRSQEIRLGGGYSGSIVNKTATENWKGRAGYQYGIDILLGQRIFLKPGIYMQIRNLDYTTIGVGEDGVPVGVETETRYTSKALRIPLMAGLRLIEPRDEPGFNMYVTGGPTALVGLSTNQDDNTLSFTTRSTQW